MTTPTNPTPTAPASAEPMFNGLTEAETAATASVAGLIAMMVDAEKLADVMKRVGSAVFGNYCEAAVTVGELNGVVYRVVAMDAMSAEDKDCADGPEWAQCVKAKLVAGLSATPPQLAEGERAEPIKVFSHGPWTFEETGVRFTGAELDGACFVKYKAALDSQAAELAKLRTANSNLKTVMVAAAEEIAAHWDAHCDSEGYGPQNLMRRLEEGIPSEYGYTAGRFAELQAELAALRASAASVQADQRDSLRYRIWREHFAGPRLAR